MTRTLHLWIAFVLSLAVVFLAMAWVSREVLRLERENETARRSAALEESVRLALWRMDTALAPLLAREASRPSFYYRSFHPAPQRLEPSPLLLEEAPFVLVHFQLDPNGVLSSPQVPSPARRALAETLVPRERIERCAVLLDEIRDLAGGNDLGRNLVLNEEQTEGMTQQLEGVPPPGAGDPRRQSVQWARNQMEFQQRARFSRLNGILNTPGNPFAPARAAGESIMVPFWVDDALLLCRRVQVNGGEYIQGCRLDWPALRRELLAQIDDLMTSADLEPARDAAARPGEPETTAGRGLSAQDAQRRLTALPVRLVAGRPRGLEPSALSPQRISLIVAWACVLVAAAAVALLMRGSLALSERRGSFVSAVSHELRTPLTTLRMYTEMLARGMVRDEERRREYLATLRDESDRLGHLVENVLAYSRIERNRPAGRLEAIALGRLIDACRERLEQRAARGGQTLTVTFRGDGDPGEAGEARRSLASRSAASGTAPRSACATGERACRPRCAESSSGPSCARRATRPGRPPAWGSAWRSRAGWRA